jgi:hypothetical protein
VPGEVHRLEHGRVPGDVGQERDLVRPEPQHVDDARLDGVERAGDERPEEGVEGRLPADDAEHQLGDEPAVRRAQPGPAEVVVREFADPGVGRAGGGQHVGGDGAGGGHGPRRRCQMRGSRLVWNTETTRIRVGSTV